tara:strand:- start:69016 stop:69483 length:468 start_codon:yes stop_codon:yes gene_type:complete
MEKFTKLIKESNNTIYRLCDEFDKEHKEINDLKSKVFNKYKEPLRKMINDLLDSYREVNGIDSIIISKLGDGEYEDIWDDLYVKEVDDNVYFSPQKITYNRNNGWIFSGWGEDLEVEEYLIYFEVPDLSDVLRAILDTDPIMSCYGIKGVRNINK